MTLNIIRNMGPPKISKKASKKNKKSWRKNIDITDVEEALEEQRFEERVGGSFQERENKDLFVLDTSGDTEDENKNKKKKEIKPFKCFSLLDGLPGAPDPAPQRSRVRTSEERMNPVVKKKKEHLVQQGFVSKKDRLSKANRENHLKQKKADEAERKTRRRMKFDFDLWGEDDKPGEQDSWVNKETKIHTDTGTCKLVPKEAKSRNVKAKTLIPAVEVPHPGQSYNPALQDHQDVLWKAAMVELDKEKEQKRLERLTTGMYPKKSEAPTKESYIKEMSVGIPELQDGDEGDDASDDDNEEEGGEQNQEEEEEREKVDGATPFKPKTRKQRRDMKKRANKEILLKVKKMEKSKEDEVYTLKSIKKDIAKKEEEMKIRQKKKEEKAIEKLKNPIRLSNYKYQPQEIEIKLSDELTGKLRNLKAEGSILEDRYKSLQRRNLVETRIVHHAKKKRNAKIVDKRSHKMGFEDELRKLRNQRIQKKRSRAKKLRMKKKN